MGHKKQPDDKEAKDSKLSATETNTKKQKIVVTKLIKSKQLSTTLSMDDNPFLMCGEA